MSGRRGHGWWPYLLPMVVFLALGELAARVPEGLAPAFLPLKVLLPGGLFLFFWSRGRYPELRGLPGGARGAALDVLVGLLGAALWMAPYLWSESLRPAPEQAFDPEQLGPSLVALALGLRALGYGIVTPFVEELFVRSWLLRYVDVFDRPEDFRDVPIGRFRWRSFAVVVLYFTFSHLPWEWPVAFVWVLLTQLWFYRRRSLAALVLVHAASNLGIFATAAWASGRWTDASGRALDLWFFL